MPRKTLGLLIDTGIVICIVLLIAYIGMVGVKLLADGFIVPGVACLVVMLAGGIGAKWAIR